MAHEPPTPTDAAPDPRFTITLYAEVTAALERHGYRQPTGQSARNRSSGATLAALARLAEAFEGVEL